MPSQSSGDWSTKAAHDISVRLWTSNVRARLPLSNDHLAQVLGPDLPPAQPSEPHAEVLHLDSAKAWRYLHARFTAGGGGANFGPWNRILSLLSSHGAATCVIEYNYVCLDYKSEILSFYAQMDERRGFATTRLHFFCEQLHEGDLVALTDKQREGYLGYVVCRDGMLPLVGRAVIRPPAYIDDIAAAREPVHFFGQTLHVHGTPFMQQDTRLAVCSQVAAWAIHYAAYRLGLVQRRVVAEMVSLSGAAEPMRPHASDGLDTDEVTRLLRQAGLGARTIATQDIEAQDLPRLRAASVPGAAALIDDALALVEVKDLLRSPEQDLALFIDDVRLAAKTTGGDAADVKPTAERLVDVLLAQLLLPYLRSAIPVYAGTEDHAMVICGLSRDGDSPTFFVHDDQHGPYLTMPSLANGSRTSLREQAYDNRGFPDFRSHPELRDFPADRSDPAALAARTPPPLEDGERTVWELVVPGPSRLMLSAVEAEADAFALLRKAHQAAGQAGAPSANTVPDWWQPFTVMMMGIDYKRMRRRWLIDAGRHDEARFIAYLHLAEWIVVVQDGSGVPARRSDRLAAAAAGQEFESGWEFVFDGSSVSQTPTVQMARFGHHLIAKHPLATSRQELHFDESLWPVAQAPDRAGKNDEVQDLSSA